VERLVVPEPHLILGQGIKKPVIPLDHIIETLDTLRVSSA